MHGYRRMRICKRRLSENVIDGIVVKKLSRMCLKVRPRRVYKEQGRLEGRTENMGILT